MTGESVFAAEFLEPCWTRLMRRWNACYLGWWHASADARELMQSAAVGAIMDAGEWRPLYRWTARAITDLDNLAGLLHPLYTGGVEGLGFIRWGLPPLRLALLACAAAPPGKQAASTMQQLSYGVDR